MLFKVSTVLSVASLASMAAAHSMILAVNGANGVKTPGFALVESTPRTTDASTKAQEADTPSAIEGDATCGSTKAGGKIDVAKEMAKIPQMPSVGPNGQVAATVHQINGDGAGPMKLEVSPSGKGGDWVTMAVTTQLPGTNGRSKAKAQDFPLEGTIPAGTKCTGGADGATCLVRAKNPNQGAGPFGGCFAVTQAGTTAKRAHARSLGQRAVLMAPLGA